jgi:hypothetical protein
MANIFKTSLGQLDVLHGDKKYTTTPELLNVMGRLHSIFKVIPKRAEFFRSMEIIGDWYQRNGYDLNDPSVQARIAAESYIESNRAIFMNDNFEVRMFRRLASGRSDAEKITATAMEIEFPIIKVASNFANEVASYTAGGIGAIYKIARNKGIYNLSNEDANFIMRNLKKNSVAALLASGVFSGLINVTLGGLYEKGEKRDPNALAPGDIAINGKKLPKIASYFLTHIPVLLALQVFQTMKNASDAERLSGKGIASRTANAAASGAAAVASHIPFVGSTERDLPQLFTVEGREKYFTNLAVSFLLPPDVGSLAKELDKDTPRKPENTVQSFENVIPGMRGDVPLNEKARRSTTQRIPAGLLQQTRLR